MFAYPTANEQYVVLIGAEQKQKRCQVDCLRSDF